MTNVFKVTDILSSQLQYTTQDLIHGIYLTEMASVTFMDLHTPGTNEPITILNPNDETLFIRLHPYYDRDKYSLQVSGYDKISCHFLSYSITDCIYSGDKVICQHEFVNYKGFTDTFDYCKKCDVRK